MEPPSRRVKYLDFIRGWHSDLRSVPSERRTQLYNSCRRGEHILIDFGSDTIKAGYPTSKTPDMVLKSLVSKSKQSTSGSLVNSTNFGYEQLDIFKNNFRNVYERNIVDHFSMFEHCNDFIFSELGCTEDHINNPLVITEAPANPLYCRQQMVELYFECYNIDQLFVGIDALFAYFLEIGGDLNRFQVDTRLVISFGATTTHVIPIIKGMVDFDSIKRLNMGGNHAFDTMAKLVTLKNPELKQYLTYPFLKGLYQKEALVSLDYKKQLEFFRNEEVVQEHRGYKNRVEQQNKHIQEPEHLVTPLEILVEKPENQISVEEQRRREEIRHRMTERLKEAIQRKRDEKLKIHQQDYDQLLDLRKRYEEDPDGTNDELVELFGKNKPFGIMKKKIRDLEVKLNIKNTEAEQKKFAFLEIPDSELAPDKLRLKRLQEYQKQAQEKRQQKLLEKEEQERKMKQLREENPEKYISELKNRYSHLSGKIKEAQRIKTELSTRNSSLNRKRLQNMVQLVEDDRSDDFGDNEDDWQLYKTGEDSDRQSELEAIEEELRDVDPSWMQNTDKHHLNTGNIIYLSTQLIRGPECYFQPSLVGNDQVSLDQAVHSALKYYSPETQRELLGSILMVGGGSQLKGLKERLHKELQSNFQTGTLIHIDAAKEAQRGAFMGMQMLVSKYPAYVKEHSMTKVQYESKKIKSQQHLFNKVIW